jgi:hypothetical protein
LGDPDDDDDDDDDDVGVKLNSWVDLMAKEQRAQRPQHHQKLHKKGTATIIIIICSKNPQVLR